MTPIATGVSAAAGPVMDFTVDAGATITYVTPTPPGGTPTVVSSEALTGSYSLQFDNGVLSFTALHLQGTSGRGVDLSGFANLYCQNARPTCTPDVSLAPHNIPGISNFGQALLENDNIGYESSPTSPTGQKWNLHNFAFDGVGIYRASTTSPDNFDLLAYVNFHATRVDAIGGPPAVTLSTPLEGDTYWTGQPVDSLYSCTDYSGTGITSCAAPVASGGPVDTSTAGTHSFTVTATDGNGATNDGHAHVPRRRRQRATDDHDQPTGRRCRGLAGSVDPGDLLLQRHGRPSRLAGRHVRRVGGAVRAARHVLGRSALVHRDGDRPRGQHDDRDALLHRPRAESRR